MFFSEVDPLDYVESKGSMLDYAIPPLDYARIIESA